MIVEKLSDIKGIVEHFRKKPVVILAVEITEERIKIKTREGILFGYRGDFLIEGIEGEIYPCGREIFFKTYEKVELKRFKGV